MDGYGLPFRKNLYNKEKKNTMNIMLSINFLDSLLNDFIFKIMQ